MILRSLIVLSLIAFSVACSKKNSSSAAPATNNLIPAIDTSCGGNSCVQE